MAELAHNPRGQQAVVISTVFTALAFVIVALRLYTRFFLVRSPGVEDYGIILAMVSRLLILALCNMLTIKAMFRRVDHYYRLP